MNPTSSDSVFAQVNELLVEQACADSSEAKIPGSVRIPAKAAARSDEVGHPRKLNDTDDNYCSLERPV